MAAICHAALFDMNINDIWTYHCHGIPHHHYASWSGSPSLHYQISGALLGCLLQINIYKQNIKTIINGWQQTSWKKNLCFYKTISRDQITLVFISSWICIFWQLKASAIISRKWYTYTSNFSQREQACKRSSGEINSRTNKKSISEHKWQGNFVQTFISKSTDLFP